MNNIIIISDNRQNFNLLLIDLVDAGFDFEVKNTYSSTKRAIYLHYEDPEEIDLIKKITTYNKSRFYIM